MLDTITIDNLPRSGVEEATIRALIVEHVDVCDEAAIVHVGTADLVEKRSCTVRFATKEQASEAVDELHRLRFRGKELRVALGDAVVRVWVGDIHKTVDDRKMTEAFKQHGALKAWIARSTEGQHLGYGFVEFAGILDARQVINTSNTVQFVINSVRPVRMTLADEWYEKQKRPDLDCPPVMLRQHQAGHFLSLHNIHHSQATEWEDAVRRQELIEDHVRRNWKQKSALTWQRLARKQAEDIEILAQLEANAAIEGKAGGPPRKKRKGGRGEAGNGGVDWMCGACGELNYCNRIVCHSCSEEKKNVFATSSSSRDQASAGSPSAAAT